MKKRMLSSSFAILVTIGVIIIILMAGPADAVILGLSMLNSDTDVIKGEDVNFEVSVEIESGEVLYIDYIILKLDNSIKNIYGCDFLDDVECKFFANGSIISGCEGILIEQTNTTNFGYGYSYGYGYEEGVLKYKITLDTNKYIVGDYKSSLLVYSGENVFEKDGAEFSIISESDLLESCSIRAKNGLLDVKGQDLDSRNKINFYVPSDNAKNGRGSLNGQLGRNRLSYGFDIIELLEDNEDYSLIYTAGKYKMGREEKSDEESLILFDKLNNKISLCGDNVNIKNMEINFKQGC